TNHLTASDATPADGATGLADATQSVTVNPAALDHFTVTDTSGSPIGTQTAGTSFNVKVRAFDQFNNLLSSGPNDYSETVDVSSPYTCPAGCIQSASFTHGVLASHSVTLTQAGASAEIDVMDHGGTKTGASATFTVNPA